MKSPLSSHPLPAGALTLCLALSACAGVKDPGDIPLAAGNLFRRQAATPEYVSQAQLAKIQPGMTRLRVKSLLGEPLLASPSQTDVWGYVVRMDDGAGTVARYVSYNLAFEGDRVVRITPLMP